MQYSVQFNETIQIRISTIRSVGKFNGVIFFGHCQSGRPYSIVADYKLIPDPSLVEVGQSWRATGHARPHRTRDGPETQIIATQLQLVMPSGREIIDWIADSRACAGIGKQTASALW